ncbi:uncharacterized protein LOC118448120 [Vespa mandarinia]|uniref:uncharacterized protein LOC118448120 n=1 Tax=Vespa mandarinia TaxID=7446 RepID=UPI00161B33CD|nr:uncharacterized protein LOC118448120 [Vespa mandarinia]
MKTFVEKIGIIRNETIYIYIHTYTNIYLLHQGRNEKVVRYSWFDGGTRKSYLARAGNHGLRAHNSPRPKTVIVSLSGRYEDRKFEESKWNGSLSESGDNRFSDGLILCRRTECDSRVLKIPKGEKKRNEKKKEVRSNRRISFRSWGNLKQPGESIRWISRRRKGALNGSMSNVIADPFLLANDATYFRRAKAH